jgi:hypothetical protein
VTRRRLIPICLTVGLFVSALAVPTTLGALSPRSSSSLPEFGISVTLNDTAPMADNLQMAQAQAVFSYVASLGADAVAINFPFYMSSQSSSTVTSGSGTPTPAALKGMIEIAEENGLKVQLRPLMSESDFDTPITGAWRGSIVPANIGEWFESYWTWLEPYLVVAEETNVGSVAIGSELNSLISPGATSSKTGEPTIGIHNFLGYWITLRNEAQAIIGDRMVYAASHLDFSTVPGIGFGYDAYYPVILPAGTKPFNSSTPASTVVSAFLSSMEKSYQSAGFAATLSATRLEEVGIAAAGGAWTHPNDFGYPSNTPVERWVQADWDTAMCDTFIHFNMTGLYFWSVNFNQFSPTYNASAALYDFEKTSTQMAIEGCFTKIRADH